MPESAVRGWLSMVLLCSCLVACLPQLAAGQPRREPRREPLDVSLNTRFEDDGRPVVAVTATRSHRSLIFHREDSGLFASRLRLTVIARRGGRQVGGTNAQVRAVADGYEATRSASQLRCTAEVVLPDDAPVELLIRAEVVGTTRWWERRLPYDPTGGGDIPWYFSGFAWNLPADGGEELKLAARVDSLVVTVGLGVRPGQEVSPASPNTLVVLLLDGYGGELMLAREPLRAPSSDREMQVRLAFAAAVFPFGVQSLAIRVEDGAGGVLHLSPDHELVNLGVPFADDESWRRHVAWLQTVVPDKQERRRLNGLPFAERAEAWAAVWRSRDGESPDETEHLGRIVEADRRFGRFGRGALSDRGRTLVFHGPPDRVEHHGMDPHMAGDWEVWYYRRLGIRVIFHDPYGIGDYRLYAELPY